MKRTNTGEDKERVETGSQAYGGVPSVPRRLRTEPPPNGN